MAFYESPRILAQYLLFHYGGAREVMPHDFGPRDAVGYPVRSVRDGVCADVRRGRALDLGCAVGRSTFELAGHANEVIGIDSSRAFIDAANRILDEGGLDYDYPVEGEITRSVRAVRPDVAGGAIIRFEVGDAMRLRDDLGEFDIVHLANLIDRLENPFLCLDRLPGLVAPGGLLIIGSPYSWLEEFTPRENWVGGWRRDGRTRTTMDGLAERLAPAFERVRAVDSPFLIPLHSRRFEWSVAELSTWRRI